MGNKPDDGDALESAWAAYLNEIAKLPVQSPGWLSECFHKMYLHDTIGLWQLSHQALIAHDLAVSIFDENMNPRTLRDVKTACEIALRELHVRFPPANRTCPKCGAKAGIPVINGIPDEVGEALQRLGYYGYGSCVIRFTDVACAVCKHKWASGNTPNCSEISDFMERRYDVHRRSL